MGEQEQVREVLGRSRVLEKSSSDIEVGKSQNKLARELCQCQGTLEKRAGCDTHIILGHKVKRPGQRHELRSPGRPAPRGVET
jgi:hypothetical protein